MNILPEKTYYFYGYPGAEEKDTTCQKPFYNRAPFQTVERKVASRSASIGLPSINFGSNQETTILELYDTIQLDTSNMIFLPKEIEVNNLLEKDILTKKALINIAQENDIRIYQAQPFSDKMMKNIYDTSCLLSLTLNDKKNMPQRLPKKYLPDTYSTPPDNYPFVAKLSRSSAGDATKIIENKQDLILFQKQFGSYGIPIIYEAYQKGNEYGIEVMRGYNGEEALLQIVESRIDENNSYQGGILQAKNTTTQIQKDMADRILCSLRDKGRYGVAGIDVKGNKYIDPNMRITQVMPAARDYRKNAQSNNMIYGSASMKRTKKNKKILEKNIQEGIIKAYAGTITNSIAYIDMGIYFDQTETIQENKRQLSQEGIYFNQ